jgi:hypothetical protein
VAAAAAAADGRRYFCLSIAKVCCVAPPPSCVCTYSTAESSGCGGIAKAAGELRSLRAAARSVPRRLPAAGGEHFHELGTMLVSAGERQVSEHTHTPSLQ